MHNYKGNHAADARAKAAAERGFGRKREVEMFEIEVRRVVEALTFIGEVLAEWPPAFELFGTLRRAKREAADTGRVERSGHIFVRVEGGKLPAGKGKTH